ncbi:transglycosylase domain-containing protein [Isoptericola sp. b408]|uniref:transglycosylase domain-containing protein n=1 Tax=Isoptericola sp. b408 TaxID=3064653 RepID=UPI002712FBEE|nr:transglycosylase domain-containing protein [Isoptericola sp. b408]MDO8152174.1 transglycosylase domain-containing protein [Isoptericola sp. b408]
MAPPESRRITRTIPATQMVALLLAFLLAAGAGGVLAAGFVIPAVAGVNAVADSTVEIYDEFPAELEPRPLSQQSRIYASNGRLLATFYYQNRIVKPLDEISENVQHAAIAIEDERFYEHNGVDAQGITRAVVNNLTNDATQGASTLTQQYVKNMLIESALQDGDQFAVIAAHESTIDRKLREAKMAIALEERMSKDEILQGYLNVAQFGHNQIYGVEAAARYYFDTTAADLTVVQAATIAGITKAPSKFDPTRNPELAQERRDLVIKNMYSLGYISLDERDEALDQPIEETLNVNPTPAGCQMANNSAFFCDYVIKELLLDPAFGETRADRQNLLYRGGLDIHTTLDMKKQKSAFKTIKKSVPEDGSSEGLEASIVSVEPGTGKILAMAQNVPYTGTKAAEKASRDTTVSYNADYLHGASGGFSPGSNFKPVVLAEWLKSGHTLNDVVNANERTWDTGKFNSPCKPLPSEEWSVGNAEGGSAGPMSVLKATYLSVNAAYADMGSRLNLCDLRGTAYQMGFRPTSTSLPTETRDVGPLKTTQVKESDINIFAPMLLGTQESSPLNMAAMYATIASGGTYCAPRAITGVTGPRGEEYEVPEADCDKNALPSNVAATMAYAMENVFTRGTAYYVGGLEDGRPVAGKTGTSQLSAQTWFSGFVPQLATTVWVGSVDNPREDHTGPGTVAGNSYDILYGSTVAAPTWKTYMDQAVKGMPVEDFGAPDPRLIGSAPAPTSAPTTSDDSSSFSTGSDSSGASDGPGNSGGNGNGNGNGQNDGSDG